MRMDPTDFADVTGYTYTYLLNGPPLTPTGQACSIPGKKCGCAVLLRAP